MASFPEPIQFNGGPDEDSIRGERFEPEAAPEFVGCDACGASLAHKSINYGFGVFCSEACAAPAERAFAERMARRGFLQVERISK
jgi:hypothetical protein